MRHPMYAALIVAATPLVGEWAAFTPDAVAALVRQLDPATAKADRIDALKRLQRFAEHPATLPLIPRLEQIARKDANDTVRAFAVLTVGYVAAAHMRPCPEVLFDALYDDGEYGGVRLFAETALAGFKPLPPAGIEKLTRYATSANPGYRDHGLSLLATHAADSPAAIKLIRAATNDPDPQHRHNAHCTLYRATNVIGDIFPHLMRLQTEYSETTQPPADADEKTKWRYGWLCLVNIGSARFLSEWTQDRTAELRDEIVAAMRHESAKVRLAAVRMVGRLADAVGDPAALIPPKLDPAPVLPPLDPKKQRAGMQFLVTDPMVRERVRELAEKDANADVREAAKQLLK